MNSVRAKIESICRLCLSGDDNLESIFGDSGSELLQMIIYDCTSVKVSQRFGYPSCICVPCRAKVEGFHQFREQCIQNDEYLRSTFLEPEVVIKTEPDFLIATDGDENNEEDDDDDEDDINEADIEEWDGSESNDVSDEANPESSPDGDITMQPERMLLQSFHARASLVPLFKCEFCSAEFAILEQLEKHITSHKEEKIFKCFYCPKTFHFAKNLNMHVEYIHSKLKYSQKATTKGPTASAQSRLVTPTEKEPTPPTISNANNNNNIIGIRGGKPIQIQQQQSFGPLNRFPQQAPPQPVRGAATGHECHVCHKTFSDLRQHMLLHDGEKPYKCDICSKSFFNASTLKTHYRVHSDENPFRCTTCTKVFDNARSLELHYRTHTGERPYSCDVCLKKFSCSSNLKRHRKLHERD